MNGNIIRVSPSSYKELKKISKEDNMSMIEIINLLVRDYKKRRFITAYKNAIKNQSQEALEEQRYWAELTLPEDGKN